MCELRGGGCSSNRGMFENKSQRSKTEVNVQKRKSKVPVVNHFLVRKKNETCTTRR